MSFDCSNHTILEDGSLTSMAAIASHCYFSKKNSLLMPQQGEHFADDQSLYKAIVLQNAWTLCILMEFPIHIDTISMGLSIVYFKVS